MNHTKLLDTLFYDTATGIFYRKISMGNRKAGTVVGNPSKKGYLKALVLGEYVFIHRLAWFYVNGKWPTMQLDHINQNKQDNRITNLRECSTHENCINQTNPRSNNKLNTQGVHKIQKTGRYRATCMIEGKKHHLGVFTSLHDAQNAYASFKKDYLPTL